MERNDNQLIADYLNGDESALPILINRYLRLIYNFIYRFTANAQDTQEITQETFLKMWRGLKKYRQNGSFKAWLYTIARNATIDWLRKKKNQNKNSAFSDFSTRGGSAFGGENEFGENLLEENIADPAPLPEELIAKTEEKIFLDSALNKLPFIYREVLLLHYKEYFTLDEIANILGKPLNTIKSQHRRGLVFLRKILESSG
jgi:RNA polymerase sigma-70 factor (ECF subfamily)